MVDGLNGSNFYFLLTDTFTGTVRAEVLLGFQNISKLPFSLLVNNLST